jgi:hypothetical protein
MKTPTQTLAAALRILANDIESPDGVANAAIAEAAERLDELVAQVEVLKDAANAAYCNWRSSSDVLGGMRKLMQTVEATPNQCLREIEAKAGRAGYLQGAKEWCKIGNENDELMLSDANEYAERIRQGGEL